jgi:membrane protein
VASYLPGPDFEETQLARNIAEIIPVSTKFISETIEDVVKARVFAGTASVVGLIWASSAAFGAIRKGVNSAWGINATRPFLKERLIDFALVVGAGLLFMLLMFATPFLESLEKMVEYFAPDMDTSLDFLWGFVAQLVTPVVTFLTFICIYRFLPNTNVEFADVWLGALLAAVAFYGAMLGFVWYVKIFPIYNAIYGSVSAIMALLTWVYLSATILLFGSLVTSKYANYVSTVGEGRGIRLLGKALSSVRLRVVDPKKSY